MRFYGMRAASLALMIAFGSGVAFAAQDEKADTKAEAEPAKSEAVKIVFEKKHLSNVKPGDEIVYHFKRTASDEKLLGQGFTDDITVTVDGEKDDGGRDVSLQIYTGDRARDLQKMPDRKSNPVLLVYFNQAVNSFSMLAGGQRNYLTRIFSMGFQDKAKVEPIKIDYKGKKVDAFRIAMAPYADDQNVSKMQGWEGAEYVLTVSDAVPGQVADLVANYKNKYPGDLHLVERITLDGVTGLEETK